jgi:hypothetical protein
MKDSPTSQQEFPHSPEDEEKFCKAITETIVSILTGAQQPSAAELLAALEAKHGWFTRHVFTHVVRSMRDDAKLTRYTSEYLDITLMDSELESALRGNAKRTPQEQSSIDQLFRDSILYRNSAKFAEALEFTAKFRDYAPYNNMLVRIQNPSCTFYATAVDWDRRFERTIKEDAKAMLILAPMHPVMLVYDIEDTEGSPLPASLLEFAQVTGAFDEKWMDRLLENAHRLRIQVQRKPLAKLHGGFATTRLQDNRFKMRVVVHKDLDQTSAFGVLCHELAHILLGHLGADEDTWWPYRMNLSRSSLEIEAEAVSYMVSARLGLTTRSAAYIASYVKDGIPNSVSFDLIVKVTSKICEMTERLFPKRPTQKEKSTMHQKSPSSQPDLFSE